MRNDSRDWSLSAEDVVEETDYFCMAVNEDALFIIENKKWIDKQASIGEQDRIKPIIRLGFRNAKMFRKKQLVASIFRAIFVYERCFPKYGAHIL